MSTVTLAGRPQAAVVGKSLSEYADDVGVKLPSSCPRNGSCRECLVEVVTGGECLSARTDPEAFLPDGFRLACQAKLATLDADVVVKTLRRQRQIVATGTAAAERDTSPLPAVARVNGRLVRGDCDLGPAPDRLLGLAADLGTTTIVLHLLDLETGQTLVTSCFENPQTFGGSDVVHRIHYDAQHPGELRRVLLAFINNELKKMPCSADEICEFVVVGNPTERDLFFGLEVQPLGQRPFKSVSQHQFESGEVASTALTATAAQLKLRMNPKGLVYGAPLLGCHVGADAAACLLAADMHTAETPIMLMDIGTNTEVLLGNRQRLLCTSCAAGPAFEGGGIRFGMPGIEGAIESVALRNGHVDLHTIGDVEPTGLCGSGLIDLAAELVRHDRVTNTGRFVEDAKEFCVHQGAGIVFTESDLQELAQAKGATFAGTSLALKHYALPLESLPALQLAGGFANYLSVDSARVLGVIPSVDDSRVTKVGNLAAEGAKQLLLYADRRTELEAVAQRVEHLDLESDPEFFNLFVEGCLFQK